MSERLSKPEYNLPFPLEGSCSDPSLSGAAYERQVAGNRGFQIV